jgi:hypothetical protein
MPTVLSDQPKRSRSYDPNILRGGIYNTMVMPRTVSIRLINPSLIDAILPIFKNVNHEELYNPDKQLSYFIKDYSSERGYQKGEILLDYMRKFKERSRVGSDLRHEDMEFRDVALIKFAYFPQIGEHTRTHVLLVLSNERVFNYFSSVLYEKIREMSEDAFPFKKLFFTFTSSNENDVRNAFDDILKIRGEDVIDDVITDLSVRGARLYESFEYQKAYTGEIRYLGLQIGNNWFIVNRNGRITTYRSLSDDDLIGFVREIILRLDSANAIIEG